MSVPCCDCRHWTPPAPPKTRWDPTNGECGLLPFTTHNDAIEIDAEYAASLHVYTAPTFSCALAEPKEPTR